MNEDDLVELVATGDRVPPSEHGDVLEEGEALALMGAVFDGTKLIAAGDGEVSDGR
jgi:hypothetical protein